MKRIFKVCLCICAALLFLCGCSSNKSNPKNTAIVVGVAPDNKPFAYLDESGELKGFEVELMKRIGLEMDSEVKFKQMSRQELLAALESGRVDVVCSSVKEIDESFNKIGRFTESYFNAAEYIVTRTESNIKSLSDLSNKIIAVENGSESERFVEEKVPDAKKIETFKKCSDIISEVKTRYCDAAVTYGEVAQRFAAEFSDELVYIPISAEKTDYAIAVYNDDELFKEVSEAFYNVKKLGALNEIFEEYFGSLKQK